MTYQYEAESRLTQVNQDGTASYAYDGAGLRVKKQAGGTTTVYIFSGTKVIAEYEKGAVPTGPTREYVYAGSQLLATLASNGMPTYHHPDHLSTRVFTDAGGNNIGERGHYPFGETWYETGAVDKWKFTSYERDSESGLDYAMFRYDSSRLGRFMTPDPLAGSILTPQSLSRYAYSLNDPTNLIDPLGLCYMLTWIDREGTIIWQPIGCPQIWFFPGGAGGPVDARSLMRDAELEVGKKERPDGGPQPEKSTPEIRRPLDSLCVQQCREECERQRRQNVETGERMHKIGTAILVGGFTVGGALTGGAPGALFGALLSGGAVAIVTWALSPIELQIHQANYDRCFSSCVADKCR